MPIKHQNWKPDTCMCRFVVSVDTDLPPDQIAFSLVSVLRACAEHPGLAGAALYDAAHRDMLLKNQVLIRALAIEPTLVAQNYLWTYDSSRVLHVAFALSQDNDNPGAVLTDGQKAVLRGEADALSIPGKVVVT